MYAEVEAAAPVPPLPLFKPEVHASTPEVGTLCFLVSPFFLNSWVGVLVDNFHSPTMPVADAFNSLSVDLTYETF